MMSVKICYALVYVAEFLIAWTYMDYLFSRKKPLVQIIFTFILGYAVLYVISNVENTIINAFCFTTVNFVLMVFNYKCAKRTAVLQAVFLSVLVAISEIMMALLVSLFVLDFAAYTYNVSVMVVVAVLSKTAYLLFSIMAARVFEPHKMPNEEPKMMALFCGLPVVSLTVLLIIMQVGLNTELTKSAELMMVITGMSLMAVNLIFLVLYNHMQRAAAENLQLQLGIQKGQAEAQYYTALQEQYDHQRILVHDIKQHIGMIENLAMHGDSEAILSYARQLNGSFQSVPQAKLYNEPTLNMLLVRFMEACQKENIVFQCDFREDSVSFLDTASITTLFGNLLSNALEAAKNSQQRQIEIAATFDTEQTAVVISVVNSCDTPPVLDSDGKYITLKKDKNLHGIGLKSVQRVVQQYKGMSTMSYDHDARRFYHIIRFPCK